MQKIRPSEQKRNQIKAVLQAGTLEALENLQRLGQETIWQESLEAEVDEHLGRAWCECESSTPRGYRNGYYRRQLTVPGSTLKVSVPRMRNTREKFSSRLLKAVA